MFGKLKPGCSLVQNSGKKNNSYHITYLEFLYPQKFQLHTWHPEQEWKTRWQKIATCAYKNIQNTSRKRKPTIEGLYTMDLFSVLQLLESNKFYDEADSEGLSFEAEDGSSVRSPTPFAGPMLQRAVLCNAIASFNFWNCRRLWTQSGGFRWKWMWNFLKALK